MKLKKIDQTRFDMIKSMIENFLTMGQDLDFVLTALRSQIDEFEHEVGVKLKIDPQSEEKVTLIDLRKDYMRTRNPNAESLVLRAKSQGVPVEVKVTKSGEYEFTNADIVSAMKALVIKLEGLDGEIKDMGHSDFKDHSDDMEESDDNEEDALETEGGEVVDEPESSQENEEE